MSKDQFQDFEEEQIGFPPYWTPDAGKHVYARVIDFDDSDPEFPRYLLQAGEELQCHKGDEQHREAVTVKKGEHFTMSAYAGLPLRKYLDIPVLIEVKDKRKLPNGNNMWTFSLKVNKDAKALLMQRRQQNALLAHNARSEHKAVPVNGAMNEGPKAEDQIPF